jgi:hypothetical protein
LPNSNPYLWISTELCRSGEIGRRTGFKILRGQPRVGSIPTSGTTFSSLVVFSPLIKLYFRVFFILMGWFSSGFILFFYLCGSSGARRGDCFFSIPYKYKLPLSKGDFF